MLSCIPNASGGWISGLGFGLLAVSLYKRQYRSKFQSTQLTWDIVNVFIYRYPTYLNSSLTLRIVFLLG
jgi:hypothetical protein